MSSVVKYICKEMVFANFCKDKFLTEDIGVSMTDDVKKPHPNPPLHYVNLAAMEGRLEIRHLMEQEYRELDDQKKSDFNKLYDDAPKAIPPAPPKPLEK